MSYDLGPRPVDLLRDPTEFAKVLRQPVSLESTVGDLDDIDDGTTYVRYTPAEQTKLSGIETGATGDQTGAEIKSLYEAEANTNAYTDAEQAKLLGIETGATADQDWGDIAGTLSSQTDLQAELDNLARLALL